MKRLMTTLVMALAFMFGALGAVDSDGPALVTQAQAAEAKVSVAVIKATKTGTIDEKSKKYSSVTSQVGGFSGFTFVTDTSFSATVGAPVDKKLAGRTLTVLVKSASGDKVSTAVTVVDPNGQKHAVSSSTKPGASVVVAAKSADGTEAHLFIVTVH